MNERINKLLWKQRLEYALFWVLSLGLIVVYEQEWLPQGVWVGNAQAEYLAQSTSILLTVILIPLSLRLFSLSLTRYVQDLPLQKALHSYARWGEVRMALLFVAMVMNLSGYYWTMNTTGLLCAGMVLVAALFCVPGRSRIMKELQLDGENDGE